MRFHENCVDVWIVWRNNNFSASITGCSLGACLARWRWTRFYFRSLCVMLSYCCSLETMRSARRKVCVVRKLECGTPPRMWSYLVINAHVEKLWPQMGRMISQNYRWWWNDKKVVLQKALSISLFAAATQLHSPIWVSSTVVDLIADVISIATWPGSLTLQVNIPDLKHGVTM